MDCLSMTYLAKFRYVQITRDSESYSVWVLHETDEHLVAEQLSACPNESREGGHVDVVSLVFPCCSLAPIIVDGEQVFDHAYLKSRSISALESSESIVCCPYKHSPFFSTRLHPRNCDTLIQSHAQSVTITEPEPTNQTPELPSENDNPILYKQNKKRTSTNKAVQRERAKRPKVTTAKAASLLLTQLSASPEQGSSFQSALPDDADIANKLNEYQQLAISQPENIDSIVGGLQLWLQQVQQRSTLHLAALQHLLTCVDLYNWANRRDNNTERINDKERWSALQTARYRNMLANELCKTKDGVSDCLGLAVLAPMTAKGLKFGNLQQAINKDKTEIVQKFAALVRPILEEGLKNMRAIEVTNPVSFVAWFLDKPTKEFADVCEALCFTELSVEDCSFSPAIWHKISVPGTLEMSEGDETSFDGVSKGFYWLLRAADRCEETAQENYEAPLTDPAHFDNTVWHFSELLDPGAQTLGFR